MFEQIINVLSFGFIIRALIVGSLIGLSASFLGIYLVILRQSMIGDGLAHVSLLTIAIALFFDKSPVLVSIPIVVGASILIMKLDDKYNMSNDSAIGLISSLAVALAILMASLSQGINIDLNSYLFGSILVITELDVILSIILSIVVIVLIIFNFNSLLIMSFDGEFAEVSGVNVDRMKVLLATLTAITVVLGIRVVGTMLISSMILFPTLSALQVSKSFKGTITLSSIISVSAIVLGIFISFFLDIPTGSTIVILNGIAFMILFVRRMIHA